MLNPSSCLKTTVKLSVNLTLYLTTYLTMGLAHAQVYNSSTSSATGDSGRASVESGDVIYLNPAMLPHLRGRHFMTSFAKDEMALSLSDNTRESTLPGALSYIQRKIQIADLQTPTKAVSARNQDFAVALAEFATEHFSVGITGHYYSSTIDDFQQTAYQQTNGDFGLAYVPIDSIGFGLVAYNFLGSRKDTPKSLRLTPTVGLGVNYIYRSFVQYRLDVVSAPEYNFGKPTLMTGMEAYVNKFFIWRLGFQDDSFAEKNFITTGLGFNGPRFALSYAYQGNTKESSDSRHSIDLQIPF